jgi:hypothetical protein
MGTNIFGIPSTFDTHNQHQTVQYTDPAFLPKRKSTHDAAVERLTQEYPPIEVGTLQVHAGETYRFDGKQWVHVPQEG